MCGKVFWKLMTKTSALNIENLHSATNLFLDRNNPSPLSAILRKFIQIWGDKVCHPERIWVSVSPSPHKIPVSPSYPIRPLVAEPKVSRTVGGGAGDQTPQKFPHSTLFFCSSEFILKTFLTHCKPYSLAGPTKCGVPKKSTTLLETKVGVGLWILVDVDGSCIGCASAAGVGWWCRRCIHMSAAAQQQELSSFLSQYLVGRTPMIDCHLSTYYYHHH